MSMKNVLPPKQQSGFALLLSLIVVGVIISVGLTVLELTITQVRLSTNARASEVAFNAANAGLECARYWRRQAGSLMENGQPLNPVGGLRCFGVTPDNNTVNEITEDITGDGQAWTYEYSFTWGLNGDRCTEIATIVASSTDTGAGLTIEAMPTRIPGYEMVDSDCDPGERCTILSVRGYNQPCANTLNFGTVQREVLLEF
jgi:type II secretory pathway pseudopilin PulG